MIWKALRSPAGLRLRRWCKPSAAGHRAPAGLRLGPPAAQPAARGAWSAQLLACAGLAGPGAAGHQSLSQRDRQLLERVRERLRDAPGEDHTLEALAKLACMSPSTLRAKFQAAYRQSGVQLAARAAQLEVKRQHLAQGWSVRRAAHFVGYRHATNFATAFRGRCGVAPAN